MKVDLVAYEGLVAKSVRSWDLGELQIEEDTISDIFSSYEGDKVRVTIERIE